MVFRFVCHLTGGKVRMLTRNALDWSSNFPAIVDDEAPGRRRWRGRDPQ
jgi:ATP-dependent DNA ligase